MKCTQQQLEGLSDRDLNIAVAKIKFPDKLVRPSPDDESMIEVSSGLFYEEYDFIHDDGESHRLMIDNGIAITPMFGYNVKTEEYDVIECWSIVKNMSIILSDENPNRAIAIRFVLMQGGES